MGEGRPVTVGKVLFIKKAKLALKQIILNCMMAVKRFNFFLIRRKD